MYIQTPAQNEAEKKLLKQGFNFSNWIPTEPDANGDPMDDEKGIMIMVRRGKTRFSKEYQQIDPEGTIN